MINYSNENLKSAFQKFLIAKVGQLHSQPKLHIVQIGNDLASTKYVGLKKKIGKKLGIEVIVHKFEENPSENEIDEILNDIRLKKEGLIFQLPVPFEYQKFVSLTPESADVDLLGQNNYKLWQADFLPPTIGAIDLVLKDILLESAENWQAVLPIQDLSEISVFVDRFEKNIDLSLDLSGKNVAIIGQGILVGRPMLQYLQGKHAGIISINRSIQNPEELVKMADIVICAAGSKQLINKNWLKEGAIVIDAATSESDGNLVGDVDQENLPKEGILCTSPSGVGRITVFYLFWNLLKLYEF